MKIGQKLISGFVGIALLIGIVGYIGFNSNRKIDKSTHALNIAHSAYEEIAKLEAVILDQVHEGMHILAFGEEECIEKFKDLGEEFEQQLAAAAAAAAQPEVKAKFEAITAAHEKFEKMFNSVVKEYYAGKLETKEQREAMHEIWCPISDEIIELTAGLQPLYVKMAEEEHEKTHRVMTKTTRNIILITIITVILAIGLGLLISRAITSPITKLKEAANEIGKGKLSTKVAIKSKDELGFLATSFNKMAEDLSGAMEKEKELAAAAAAAAESEKKKAEELARMNEELESTNEELKGANEELESASEELRKANEEAQKAKEEAENKATQLERFNKVAVGRELKMVELKEEVNTLLKELGRERRYRKEEKTDKPESA